MTILEHEAADKNNWLELLFRRLARLRGDVYAPYGTPGKSREDSSSLGVVTSQPATVQHGQLLLTVEPDLDEA